MTAPFGTRLKLARCTGLEGSENYPMHCTGCRPAKEARKPEAGQKKISAFLKKPGA